MDNPSLAMLKSNPPAHPTASHRTSFRICDILQKEDSTIISHNLSPSHPVSRKRDLDEESYNDETNEEDRASSSKSTTDSPSPTPSGGKKPRKARTIFSDKQLQSLEESFEKQKYLSVQDRMELAARMGLTDTQVKTWYQNRRTKWKRQTAVGLELLHEANNIAAVRQIMSTNPYWAAYLSAQIAPAGIPPHSTIPFLSGGLPIPPPPPSSESTTSNTGTYGTVQNFSQIRC